MSQASDDWWIGVNVAVVLTAFFNMRPLSDQLRRIAAASVLHQKPANLLEYGDTLCSCCGPEIETQYCHCGDPPSSHGWEHSFIPAGCTCSYHDADSRALIPPIVLGPCVSL